MQVQILPNRFLMPFNKVLVGLLLVFVPWVLWAQLPPHVQISEDEGLPSTTVYDLFQDSKGYIWLGSDGGLYRYDGIRFKRYGIKSAFGRSITNFLEDNNGLLWMRNFSNEVFYLENDSIKRLDMPKEWIGTGGNNLQKVDNRFLFMNLSTLSVFIDVKSKKVQPLKNSAKYNGYTFFYGKDSLLNFQQFIGLTWYRGEQSKKMVLEDALNGSFFTQVKTENKVFIANSNGIFAFDVEQELTVRIADMPSNASATLLNFRSDKDGYLWLCTAQGAYVLTTMGSYLFDGKPLLSGIAVSDLLHDNEGNYWLSTIKNGIFRFPDLKVKSYTSKNSALSSDLINKVAVTPAGKVFVGTGDGQIHTKEKDNFRSVYQFGHYDVLMLKYSASGNAIFAGAEKMIALDPKTALIDNDYSIGGHIREAEPLDANTLLLGFSYMSAIFTKRAGLSFPKTGWYRQIKDVRMTWDDLNICPDSAILIREKRTRATFYDNNKKEIWIAYADGLYCHSVKASRKITYQNQAISATSIASTKDGHIWVSTVEQGLFEIVDYKVVRNINTTNGLIDNYGVYMTTSGNFIYVCTNNGLAVFNTETNKFTIFERKNGLPTRSVNHLALVRDGVWLATSKGLLFVPNLSLFAKSVLPLVQIVNIEVKGEVYKGQNTEIKLPYDSASLNIAFWSPIYRSMGKHRYKYRILGLDSTWFYAEANDAVARIPSLPDGQFIFEVCAMLEDGTEGSLSKVSIVVKPPYWKTWWFILLATILLVGIVGYIFSQIIAAIQRRNQIEHELRKSQLAALQTQMNPHFIFNALNSIQEFILQNEKRLANAYLSKFANLMRLILNMSTQEYVLLDEELKVLRLYLELEAIRFEDLDYEIIVNENVATDYIKIPSMLIQPYIENAMKHGLLHLTNKQKLLKIEFGVSDDETTLWVNIKDNGIGRKKSAQYRMQQNSHHRSFATSATQKRLELLNTERSENIGVEIVDIETQSGGALGTEVRLRIPV